MKRYLIIGGSSGIAENVTLQLLSQGNHITTTGREKWKGIAHENHQHLVVNAVEETKNIELPDELDGLLYAPGTINLKPFRGLKDQDFLNDFEVNVLGAIRIIRHAHSSLKKGSPGSVVLFSTVAVAQGMPFHSSVSASKGAIEGLTRSLAAEFAPLIRVNAIAPSLTETPMAAGLLSNEKRQEASAERHPLKRYGHPEDIANAAIYLLTEKSSWVSGQILHVDGGMSKLRV